MRHLILYLRILRRNRLFAFISIGGFALSLAVVLLLLSFVRSEKQYDRDIPDLDRVYRVVTDANSAQVPEQARETILESFPQVEAACKASAGHNPVLYEEVNHNVQMIHSDSGFFDVFGIPIIQGQREGLFADPHQAVLTRSCAERIFGEDEALGKILNVGHREDVEVVAIAEDFPEKNSLQGEMILSTQLRLNYSRTSNGEKTAYLYSLFLRLDDNEARTLVDTSLTRLIYPYLDWYEREYLLQPMKEAYFDTSMHWDHLQHANVKLIRLLSWLSLVIMVLAVFNYINLAIAQSTGRLHELGVRQVFGSDRPSLVRQYSGEALIQVCLSMAISLLLALLIRPVIEGILGKEISLLLLLSDPVALVLVAAGLLLIAMVSGIYPALSIWRLQPKEMLLNQHSGIRSRIDIRRVLTVVQFTAMVTLIISLITLMRQINYVQDRDMGYNTELLVRIQVHWRIQEKVPALMDEISSLAVVKNVCASHGTPGEIWNNSSDDKVRVSQIGTDYRFLETYDLSLIYGRNFFPAESTKVSIINRTMMEELGGWDSVENRSWFGHAVVGVVEDFHYEDLYSPIGNLQLNNVEDVGHIVVRFHRGDISQALEDVEKAFLRTAPGFAFSYDFYDEWLDSKYRQEERRSLTIRLLSILAILISCMGLYGMAEFTTSTRTREIGIRKVNGAGVSQIIFLLNLGFLKWILPGILLGMPIGWYIMDRWLSGFAYRTRLDWWIFALAALASILVALLTVSWQCFRTARKNPIESLRYE